MDKLPEKFPACDCERKEYAKIIAAHHMELDTGARITCMARIAQENPLLAKLVRKQISVYEGQGFEK